LYAFLITPTHAACPAHLTLHHLIVLIIFAEQYKLWSSSLCNFLQPPVTSSLLGQNILLGNLFSNTLNMRDQVSHPRKTTGTTIVLCILIFTF
jgi:hypothetical protein